MIKRRGANMHFIGIECGSHDYKLQQLVKDESGKSVAKNYEIVLWVAFRKAGGIIYIPISKHDLETYHTISLAEMLNVFNDRTRSLVKKTADGSSITPCGYLFVPHC